MKRITLVVALFGLACGSDRNPVKPAPPIVQVSGMWDYTAPWTRYSGGTCIAVLLHPGLSDTGTIQMNQAGSSVSATVAGTTSILQRDPGMACPYSGTADATSISLSAPACPALTTTVRCINGVIAEVTFSAGILSAVVNGGTAIGELTETYTARSVSGGDQGQVTIVHSFSATRR